MVVGTAHQFGGGTRAHLSKTYTSSAFAEGGGDINTSADLVNMPGPGSYTALSSLGQDPRYSVRPTFHVRSPPAAPTHMRTDCGSSTRPGLVLAEQAANATLLALDLRRRLA